MNAWVIVGVVAFLATFAAFIVAGVAGAKKRVAALRELAVAHGFAFDETAGGVVEALSTFPLFQQGSRRAASNLLSRGNGADSVWVLDYRYTIGGGKNRHTVHQVVVAFPYLDASLPEFQLRPENFLHKIGQVFGYQDIDLADQPAFSKRFLLRGPDVGTIQMLFDEPTVQVFDAVEPLCIEGGGSCLLFYIPKRLVQPDRLMTLVEDRMRLRDAFVQSAKRLL